MNKGNLKKVYWVLFAILAIGLALLLLFSHYNFNSFKTNAFKDPLMYIDNWNVTIDGTAVGNIDFNKELHAKDSVILSRRLDEIEILSGAADTLYFETYYNSVEVFFSGEKVYSYPAENASLLFGKDIPLCSHFINLYTGDFCKMLVIKLYPSEGNDTVFIKPSAITTKAQIIVGTILKELPQLLIDLTTMCLGIAVLCAYVIMRSYNKYPTLLSLGLLLICYTILDITFTHSMLVLMANKHFLYMLSYAACSLIGALWVSFAWNLANKRRYNLFSVFAFYCVMAPIAALLLHVCSVIDYHDNYAFILTSSVGIPVITLVVLFFDGIKYKEASRLSFIGISSLLLLVIVDIGHYILNLRMARTFALSAGLLVFSVCYLLDMSQSAIAGLIQQSRVTALEFAAYHDQLTGCGNRRSFDRSLELYRSKKEPKNPKISTLAMAMFDCNNLKVINDTYGHARGDQLIIDTVEAITAHLGNFGKVYRTGGDEFVLVSECSDRSAFRAALAAFDEEVNWGINQIGVSWGEAFFEETLDKTPDSVLMRAEHRMYEYKRGIKL